MQICHGNNWYLQSWVIITVMTYPKQKHTITMVCVQSMSKINLTGWYLYQSVPDLGLHQKCTIWSEKSLGVNTFRSTHSFTSEGQFLGRKRGLPEILGIFQHYSGPLGSMSSFGHRSWLQNLSPPLFLKVIFLGAILEILGIFQLCQWGCSGLYELFWQEVLTAEAWQPSAGRRWMVS